MQTVFKKTPILTDAVLHYCPGCGHGIVHRLVAEVVDELGIQDRTIAIVPVGCAVFGYKYFNLDSIEAAHGRAPAAATGVKRTNPNNVVSHIRVTATLLPSARLKSFTLHTAAKRSPRSSSTMQFTA